jgi:hypothetical protein
VYCLVMMYNVVLVMHNVLFLMMHRVMSLGHRHRRQRKQNDHE